MNESGVHTERHHGSTLPGTASALEGKKGLISTMLSCGPGGKLRIEMLKHRWSRDTRLHAGKVHPPHASQERQAIDEHMRTVQGGPCVPLSMSQSRWRWRPEERPSPPGLLLAICGQKAGELVLDRRAASLPV